MSLKVRATFLRVVFSPSPPPSPPLSPLNIEFTKYTSSQHAVLTRIFKCAKRMISTTVFENPFPNLSASFIQVLTMIHLVRMPATQSEHKSKSQK